MYVVIIERADRDPEAVTFENLPEAETFREEYETATEERWDDDPQWNNYPRGAQRALSPAEAFEKLNADIEEDKKHNG